MAARQVKWARKARERLRLALGSACSICKSTDELEFDCIEPRGHNHHGMGVIGRTCFYRKQARLGNLQLLCRIHHMEKSSKEHPDWDAEDTIPV